MALPDVEFPAPSPDKRDLRREARERYAALDLAAISADVTAQIASLPEIRDARHVLLYLASPREIAVESLAERFSEKHWYAPGCVADHALAIYPFHPQTTPLIRGAFGLREPDARAAPGVEPEILDAVLVPGLLFTPDGDRLGHGGGYYDRFLPRLSPTCCRIGVACDATVVDALPSAAWDARVDVVVTETRLFRPRPRRVI